MRTKLFSTTECEWSVNHRTIGVVHFNTKSVTFPTSNIGVIAGYVIGNDELVWMAIPLPLKLFSALVVVVFFGT